MSSKSKSGVKVKNACKYCHEKVTNKNGLQCQGACKKWAHYKCLNYTPGKISDVKAGIIKVMCPCPDCETTQAKEVLTNPPFSCSNNTCPANGKGPKSDTVDCPSNRRKSDNVLKRLNKSCPNDPAQYPQIKKPPCPRCKSPVYNAVKPTKMSASVSSGSFQISKCKNSGSCLGVETEPKTQAAMVHALQEMCGTVGQLSIQIRDLMGKINNLSNVEYRK